MRVLLAGGAGFIGSHVADALLARGDQVVAIDNFATGRHENVAHLSGNAKFTLIEHDITFPWPTHDELEAKFDAVLDYASPASPNDFATMPLEILAVGSTGTRNLLDRAKADGAVFFLTSTSEVYGDPQVHPQPETYWGNVSSIGPRSCYDEAKRFSEALTMAYHRVHGVDVRIVRIFNTYGERMRPNDGRVVNTFVVQALRGEPLTLHGDGSQTRSFCHVSDEVRGLMALLDSDYNLPVNVGNPGEFTMRELAELVIDLTGSSSEIVSIALPPERDGDPLQRKPDITLANEILGWEPKISLHDGLQRMIKHFIEVEGIA
jgi:dTDP-glucose 4,6-dehydratase